MTMETRLMTVSPFVKQHSEQHEQGAEVEQQKQGAEVVE